MKNRRNGFTFIEVMLAMAIVSTISIVILSNYSTHQPVRELASAKQKIAVLLRDASTRSMNQVGGGGWGVRFGAFPTSSFFALYSGTYSTSSVISFASLPRSLRFDTSTFNGSTTKDVSFGALTGKANASTSIRVYVLSNPSQSSTIRISSSGLISVDSTSDSNLALGKNTYQVSTVLGGVSSRAVDGNTNGDWAGNSVTHTQISSQPWWEVDLGQSYIINQINVWNRTDNCITTCPRLSNYYVLVSDSPFSGSLATILSTPGVWSNFQAAAAGSPTPISVIQSGRYVRVQLFGSNYLHMAEVEVLGR